VLPLKAQGTLLESKLNSALQFFIRCTFTINVGYTMNSSNPVRSVSSFGYRGVQEQEMIDWLEVTPGHYAAQYEPYNLSIFAIMVGQATFMIYGARGRLLASGNCSSIRDAKAQAERKVKELSSSA
jgi:hypothetical protein